MKKKIESKFVHIKWTGPFKLDEVKEMNRKDDSGVYQIYGNHPIYGFGILLYIGKAVEQTFGHRIQQEISWLKDKDNWPIEIYIGKVDESETNFKREELTNLVEQLLIYSHQPACNSSNIGKIPHEKLRDLHILNWDLRRDLLPEVSGARWTNYFDED
jgi:hypothetical protein